MKLFAAFSLGVASTAAMGKYYSGQLGFAQHDGDFVLSIGRDYRYLTVIRNTPVSGDCGDLDQWAQFHDYAYGVNDQRYAMPGSGRMTESPMWWDTPNSFELGMFMPKMIGSWNKCVSYTWLDWQTAEMAVEHGSLILKGEGDQPCFGNLMSGAGWYQYDKLWQMHDGSVDNYIEWGLQRCESGMTTSWFSCADTRMKAFAGKTCRGRPVGDMQHFEAMKWRKLNLMYNRRSKMRQARSIKVVFNDGAKWGDEVCISLGKGDWMRNGKMLMLASSGGDMDRSDNFDMTMYQRNIFSPTRYTLSYMMRDGDAPVGGYHVHSRQMDDNDSGDCTPDSTGGHWNPYGLASPFPMSGNDWEYEIGDLARKHGSLAGSDQVWVDTWDYNLPLYGPNSVASRSIVFHHADTNARQYCWNLVWGDMSMMMGMGYSY